MSDFAAVLDLLASAEERPALLYGVAAGVVTNNKDPDGLGRVKVRFPWLADDHQSDWARVVTPMAGKGRGLYLLPEVGDEVLVAFEHGRPDVAYVLGGLWNGKAKPPADNQDGKNNRRLLSSRSGLEITLDDTAGKETVRIAGKQESITIDVGKKRITIESSGDVTVKAGAGGKLTLQGGSKGVEIKSEGEVKVEATGNLELKASALVNVKGRMINLN